MGVQVPPRTRWGPEVKPQIERYETPRNHQLKWWFRGVRLSIQSREDKRLCSSPHWEPTLNSNVNYDLA